VTASLGVTCLGDAEDTADALLARADRAMYAAKNAGRNRCVALPPNDGA
jgi:diguanylate cyclase (GGDEF)-like protein